MAKTLCFQCKGSEFNFGQGTRSHQWQPRAFPVALVVKNPLANAGDVRDSGLIPRSGKTLEEGTATHSSILVWRTPWTEGPGGLTVHTVAESETSEAT